MSAAMATLRLMALAVPSAAVTAGLLAALAGWIALHRLPRTPRGRAGRGALSALRLAAATLTLLAGGELLGRWLVLTTDWSLPLLALLGAAAVEGVIWLYRLERRTVSRRLGLAASALRVALVLAVLLMLAQPVRVWTLRQEDPRYVVLLVDDSLSMAVADSRATVAERLRWAGLLDPAVPQRPWRFEQVRRRLEAVHETLATMAGQLEQAEGLTADQRGRWLADQGADLHARLSGALQTLEAEAARIAAPLDGPATLPGKTRQQIQNVVSRLKSSVRDAVDRAARVTDPQRAVELPRQSKALASNVTAAAGALAKLLEPIARVGDEVDEAFYASLDEAQRQAVDAAAGMSRRQIVRALLTRPAGGASEAPSLLDAVSGQYTLKIYRFSDSVQEATREQVLETASSGAGARTDLTGALRRIVGEIPVDHLSGIIVVTDGQATSARPPKRVASRQALAQVPVHTVLVGSQQAPRDAALVSVDAPSLVSPGDKVAVTARVAAHGLAGQTLDVRLMAGDEAVATRTVKIDSDAFQAAVVLAHEPKDAGLRAYRVELTQFDGEAFNDNNVQTVAVTVRDDTLRLLIVEGRPRWEFRYIRNLFADRDRMVRLQHVLLEPDRIAVDEPVKAAPRAASATEEKHVEATALPGVTTDAMTPAQRQEQIVGEWLKFDVVLFGDVDPAHLRPEDFEALRRFVVDRGGTLIVSAGDDHLPHHYGQTPLKDLLPVAFLTPQQIAERLRQKKVKLEKDDPLPIVQPEPHFQFALTGEGRQHEVLRLDEAPDASLAVWDGFPEIYWRHPYLTARPAARVLAFAMPDPQPEFYTLSPQDEAALSPGRRTELAAQRRQFERDNALIVVHTVGHGRVLMLNTDRTWRMRYRVGDVHHHRFWGQALRWAAADRLPDGAATVRLGADRPRYTQGERPVIQAQIRGADFAPIRDEDAFVTVYDEANRQVLRTRLAYVADSAGRYRAELPPLESGLYKVELDSPQARAILAADPAWQADAVRTELAVMSASPVEQIALAAEPATVGRVAALTGGRVVAPDEAGELAGLLGRPSEVHYETGDYRIWDSWPLLAAFLILAGAEWLIRKKAGLP